MYINTNDFMVNARCAIEAYRNDDYYSAAGFYCHATLLLHDMEREELEAMEVQVFLDRLSYLYETIKPEFRSFGTWIWPGKPDEKWYECYYKE